ncbi:hypothetical protein [Lysinibacter sp. HNR]|uniref:hypothetical protein n=1 Tax=Lysinibacter sp. HNR TaxID=3031408 RepID=UPI0024353AE8|nr:hypothetical protein [Lysinibacter sp. HNR]WGD37380.1 hypothetical protein FrondiHNR_00205 [Lysinibacter sp. HNR]
MKYQTFRSLGVVAAAALLLAGCSGASDKKTAEDSPLAAYLSTLYGDSSSFDQKSIDQEQKKIEDAVAVCMAEEGFEYTPFTGNVMVLSADDDFYTGMGTLEWAEKNGYGYTTFSTTNTDGSGDETQEMNPNDEYVESLSEGEQEAYYLALHGEPVEEPREEDLEEGSEPVVSEYDWETAGCYGKASHEVQGTEDPSQDPEYKDLFDELYSLYSKSTQDPKVIKAQQEWANCMADAGYPDLKEQGDAQNLVQEKQSALYGYADAPEGTSEEWEPSLPTVEQQDEVKEYEIQVAVADFKCGEKTNSAQVQLDAQFALEEEFIAKNKAKLDAMLAQYGKK